MSYKSKIKPYTEPKNFVKAFNKTNIKDENPLILFTYFNGHSVNIDNEFNNYYANSEESISAVYSFIDKIKNIQKKPIKELFSGKDKKQMRCHPIRDKREVDRINNVLLKGYNFPKQMIENFENDYYEFGLDNGSRVIFVKIDNIFELLFIDNNHMIYLESSRLLKSKNLFEYPSCFGKIDFSDSYQEYSTDDIIRMMIESYENGEYNKLDDFVNDLKELLEENCNKEMVH